MKNDLQEEKDQSSELEKPYFGKTIRFFVSYSTKDKLIAAKIKELLERYGFEVFLAHEDIRPSEDWQDILLQNLESTDIFVPIISHQFKKSSWTDQESGYALARGKKIIPLAINQAMPYGFIAAIQAVKCKVKDLKADLLVPCERIVEEVKKDAKFRESYVDSLVRVFGGSYSFDNASSLSIELEKIDDFSSEQINQIAKYSLENSQIKQSFKTRPRVMRIVKKFEGKIDSELLKKFNLEYNPQEVDVEDEEEIPF